MAKLPAPPVAHSIPLPGPRATAYGPPDYLGQLGTPLDPVLFIVVERAVGIILSLGFEYIRFDSAPYTPIRASATVLPVLDPRSPPSGAPERVAAGPGMTFATKPDEVYNVAWVRGLGPAAHVLKAPDLAR